MKTFTCRECETEFLADHASVCLKCGSPHISLNIAQTASDCTEEAEGKREAEIRGILGKLCLEAEDALFRGVKQEQAINRTLERLRPFIQTA